MTVDLGESLLLLECSHCVLEDSVVHSFATSSRSYNHETVTHLDGIVDLEHFLNEKRNFLNIVMGTTVANFLLEVTVIYLGSLKTWEQIQDNVLEQRNIILEEFWHVDISQGSEKKLLLIGVWIVSFKKTCSVDDRSHCSHTVIVMILGRELLRGKSESGDHLFSETTTFKETE